jgi:flagellar biosynthesis protein FlhF
MADAMAECRQVLGPDALILSTRRTAAGVEVTAALEPAEEPPPPPPVLSLQTAPDPLARHNLPSTLRARIGTGMPESLAAVLRFAALPDGVSRPLALVGPPGAGKTLSGAKLATRMVLRGTAPLLVSTDSQRAGAAEQISAFARVLGLPLTLAATGVQLAQSLSRRIPGQPMILDTAGCDPFDAAQAEQLLALLRVTDAAPLLVLPAGLDPEEAAETARAFAALGARHLLPTRLDGARRLGGILAAAFAGPLALTEAGTGPGAADGLTPLTPAWLSARLHGPARSAAQEAA